MVWLAGVGAALVRWGWGCVGGTSCKWLAVLTMNETAFLFLVRPCSLMSSTSKSRADLYEVTKSRKIKVDIFYAAHHLRNPWQTQYLQETELLTFRITNRASFHMALLFKQLSCKSQNPKDWFLSNAIYCVHDMH